MIKKLYITTYLRARHQIMSEVNQKTLEKASEIKEMNILTDDMKTYMSSLEYIKL
jgi:hypothetical protein